MRAGLAVCVLIASARCGSEKEGRHGDRLAAARDAVGAQSAESLRSALLDLDALSRDEASGLASAAAATGSTALFLEVCAAPAAAPYVSIDASLSVNGADVPAGQWLASALVAQGGDTHSAPIAARLSATWRTLVAVAERFGARFASAHGTADAPWALVRAAALRFAATAEAPGSDAWPLAHVAAADALCAPDGGNGPGCAAATAALHTALGGSDACAHVSAGLLRGSALVLARLATMKPHEIQALHIKCASGMAAGLSRAVRQAAFLPGTAAARLWAAADPDLVSFEEKAPPCEPCSRIVFSAAALWLAAVALALGTALGASLCCVAWRIAHRKRKPQLYAAPPRYSA